MRQNGILPAVAVRSSRLPGNIIPAMVPEYPLWKLQYCYSHSSYNGKEEINPYLTDEKGQPIIDLNTGKIIPNPEFDKINKIVTGLKEHVGDNYKNPTIPKALVVSNNGDIYMVDKNGNTRVFDSKSLNVKATTIPIHEIIILNLKGENII